MSSQTLASSTRQARKLRVLTWSLSALAIAACGWASTSMDPAALILAPIGVSFAAALHFYMCRYITSLELHGDAIVVRTAGVGAPVRRIARKSLGRRTYHSSRTRYGGPTGVDAPWITLHVDGFRVPFVIDAQIEVLDLSAIKRL